MVHAYLQAYTTRDGVAPFELDEPLKYKELSRMDVHTLELCMDLRYFVNTMLPFRTGVLRLEAMGIRVSTSNPKLVRVQDKPPHCGLTEIMSMFVF